jgi:hypothetical protein
LKAFISLNTWEERMSVTSSSQVSITNFLGFMGFLVLWLGLVEGSKLLLKSLRKEPLLGWAISPLGVTTLFLYEPSLRFILASALVPALVSGGVLYIGLFSGLPGPVMLSHSPLMIFLTLLLGILLTCFGDWVNALRDLRYPLWGEARVLHNLHILRESWASIHFTQYGRTYLREHFGENPAELLHLL